MTLALCMYLSDTCSGRRERGLAIQRPSAHEAPAIDRRIEVQCSRLTLTPRLGVWTYAAAVSSGDGSSMKQQLSSTRRQQLMQAQSRLRTTLHTTGSHAPVSGR